jgi:hypothetical protein
MKKKAVKPPPTFEEGDKEHWSIVEEVPKGNAREIRASFSRFIEQRQGLIDSSVNYFEVCDWMIEDLKSVDTRYRNFPAEMRKSHKKGYFCYMYKYVVG